MRRFASITGGLFSRPKAVHAASRPDPGPSETAIPIGPSEVFLPSEKRLQAFVRFDTQAAARIAQRKAEKPGGKHPHVFHRGIPYSKYLDEWQFHPGRIGGLLTNGKQLKALPRVAKSVCRRLVELPNGGLALYYPHTIRAARLQTNEPIYSGIAQGQLLAGFMRLIRDRIPSDDAAEWPDIAHRIAKSMMLPFEEGGVCVDGEVILEAPNVRACPETILNGWIDALIHLHDYLEVYPRKKIQRFYERNIAALADMLPAFDDEAAKLSLYSNLSPYVFRVRYSTTQEHAAPPPVRVEYLPRSPDRHAYCIPDLWPVRDTERECIYENKIQSARVRTLDLSLSVSSLYDTKIYIDADCASLSFDPGTFNETSTVPRPTFRTRTILPSAKFNGTHTVFVIAAAELGLMAGCPTNFLKKGKNFYHAYHVVSLYDLALCTRDSVARKAMTDMAARWYSYMNDRKHAARGGFAGFSDPDSIARNLARLRAVDGQPHSFEALRGLATRSSK